MYCCGCGCGGPGRSFRRRCRCGGCDDAAAGDAPSSGSAASIVATTIKKATALANSKTLIMVAFIVYHNTVESKSFALFTPETCGRTWQKRTKMLMPAETAAHTDARGSKKQSGFSIKDPSQSGLPRHLICHS
jgi:hypothetical protein